MCKGILKLSVVLMLLVMGCSSSSNPVTISTGDLSNPDEIYISGNLPVGVSDFDNDGSPAAGMSALGMFNLAVDPINISAELTSLRSASLPDVLEVVDITNFLQLAPCADCAKIESVSLDDDGNLVVSIGIKHPFEEGDPLKPITGKNRGDLHVFNVEGIVFSNNSAVSFPGIGKSVADFRLLNASGYTGYLDPVIDSIYPTAATIHPYILHFDDYSSGNFDPSNPMGFSSVTDPPPNGNLIMAMGCDYDFKDYVFALRNEPVDFIYVVGCTYAVSSGSRAERFNPEFRVPQHLKKAASEVWVDIVENNLAAENTESSATLHINVVDVSHGVPVGDALNEMLADSSVSGVSVEVPGVTAGAINFSTIMISGTGHDTEDPLIFEGEITNSAGGDEGTYLGLVKVTDSYPPGLNESPLLDSQDGIERVDPIVNPLEGLFAIPEFATYQVFSIFVETGNEMPVAILNPNPARGCDGGSIWFDGSDSYDPDGTIELYEFDFNMLDGDPENFEADVSGTDARVQSPPYDTGDYWAALRVTDNLGGIDIDIVPVNIRPIDGFDISPYSKVYVTDESFSNIIFTPNGFDPDETQNRQLGLSAMATGSEYIYAVFYASGNDGNGVYIARSGNDGESWDDYYFVHEVPSGSTFRGTAITAVGSEVFVAIGEQAPNRLVLRHNESNGEGGFDEYILSNRWSECSISVAVDPVDTNNVYVGAAEIDFHTHHNAYAVFVSNTGPAGTFTENNFRSFYRGEPYNSYAQAYTSKVVVAPNRNVYIFCFANYAYDVHMSDDFGANFTTLREGWDSYPWGREADIAFDPNNPDTIYWTVTYRVPNQYRHALKRSTNGGSGWSHINNNLHGGVNGYTNTAITTDKNGNLYLVYTDKTSGYGEVFGRYSTNQAASFDPAFVISDTTNNNGHVEIITTTDGCDVVVGWLEDRDGTRRVVSHRG